MAKQALAYNTVANSTFLPINNASSPITLNATSDNNQKTNPIKGP
jgi:hypothetical protein